MGFRAKMASMDAKKRYSGTNWRQDWVVEGSNVYTCQAQNRMGGGGGAVVSQGVCGCISFFLPLPPSIILS
jgi:hypothetical protein